MKVSPRLFSNTKLNNASDVNHQDLIQKLFYWIDKISDADAQIPNQNESKEAEFQYAKKLSRSLLSSRDRKENNRHTCF